MRGRFLAGLCGVLVIGHCACGFAASAKYTITEIPLAPGDTVGYAYGINTSGQVVGFSSQTDDPRFGPRDAYLYSNGQFSTVGIPSGNDSQAYGINDSGQIVGQENGVAFIDTAGQFTSIGLGGPNSYALSVNNSGQVTGYAYVDNTYYHAFLYNYSNHTTTDINPAGWNYSNGNAINTSGQIVGELYNGSTNSFLYSNNQLTNITTSPIGLYAATGINDGGKIVGYQTSGAAEYYNGTSLVPLGTFAGFPSVEPSAINSLNVIVGTGDSAAQVQRAFIYTGGTLTDLNTLISPTSGWTLQTAQDINTAGQIVGQGLDPSGNERAYLLTPIPVPEPSSLAMLGICGIGLLRRHKSVTKGNRCAESTPGTDANRS